MPRPMIIEMREGRVLWQIRADFTNHKWKETFLPIRRPFHEVREDVSMVYPQYAIELSNEIPEYDA